MSVNNVTRNHHRFVRDALVVSGKKMQFADSGEYISGDGTDLTIASGGDIALNATDVTISGDLTVTGNKIALAGGGTIEQETSTTALHFSNEKGYAFNAISGQECNMYIRADAFEDDNDKWMMQAANGGDLSWWSYATGSYVQLMTLENNGQFTINCDNVNTNTSTTNALSIDYDHTAIVASGQVVTGRGLHIDMNCDSVTHVGTVTQTGIDIDMVALTDGAQSNTGINISCLGADNNYQLQLSHDADNWCRMYTEANGATTIETSDSDGTSGDLHLDIDGSIRLDCTDGFFGFYHRTDTDDYFKIEVLGNTGETSLTTVSEHDDGHLTLDADGDIVLDPVDKISLSQEGDEYGFFSHSGSYTHLRLYENGGVSTADYFDIRVLANGATTLLTTDAADSNAHLTFNVDGHIDMGKATGFTKIAETFSDDSIIVSGGTDDTHIDFRASNKISLAVTGDITNLNLIFPAITGNFVLLLTYDGNHDITNWKVYESDESPADGDADVLWAGGTAPDTTAGGIDIFSFFYDATADAEKCYGAASLDFSN